MQSLSSFLPLAIVAATVTLGCDGGAGSSGSPIPECAAGEDLSEFEIAGFGDDHPDWPSDMTVTAVSPSSLKVAAASGKQHVFQWVGPDLTGHFQAGDPVLVDIHSNFQIVSNADTFAAALFDSQVGSLSDPGPLPFGGPTLTLAPPCQVSGLVHFGLVGKWGATEITVKSHQTGTLGPYQIHNGGVSFSAMVGEDAYDESITALGPTSSH